MPTNITKAQLVGSWELLEFLLQKDGVSRQWNNNAHGLLLYTDDGHVSVSINSQVEGAGASDTATLSSILFYAGTFEIRGNQVVHHVCNASDPNRVGKDMIRDAELGDGLLALIARGDFGEARLVWRKKK